MFHAPTPGSFFIEAFPEVVCAVSDTRGFLRRGSTERFSRTRTRRIGSRDRVRGDDAETVSGTR